MAPERTTPRADLGAEALQDVTVGFVLSAAAANVIMQLSWLPIGHGVAESTVESGRADVHPLKRLRTTLSYLMIAGQGTDEERAAMRREVNRSHRQVRSGPDSPVRYNAFDPELQLWVAACLYWGVEDVYTKLYGPPDPETRDALYREGARLGTTLQVTEDMWPADREAFDAYWEASLERIEMDRTTRTYLLNLAGLHGLPAPARWLFGATHRFLTTGFLPQRFRDELGLPWSPRRQAAFDRYVRVAALVNRLMPRPIREFPMNVYFWDVRRRIRQGRPIV